MRSRMSLGVVIVSLACCIPPASDPQADTEDVPKVRRAIKALTAMDWSRYVRDWVKEGILLPAAPARVLLRRHAVFSVRTPTGTEVRANDRHSVEVSSAEEHFGVKVSGQIVGPELAQLFGPEARPFDAVPVYVLVQEFTRHGDWLQDPALLYRDGHYEAQVYLGGKGAEQARDGEIFQLVIYTPTDRNATIFARYDNRDDLPHGLMTTAFLLITRRPEGWTNVHAAEREQADCAKLP